MGEHITGRTFSYSIPDEQVVRSSVPIQVKEETVGIIYGKGRALFGCIVSLAHKLDMAGICEGVETEEQNTLVSQSDCDYIQGWYYAKAMPVDECEIFVESYNMS